MGSREMMASVHRKYNMTPINSVLLCVFNGKLAFMGCSTSYYALRRFSLLLCAFQQRKVPPKQVHFSKIIYLNQRSELSLENSFLMD